MYDRDFDPLQQRPVGPPGRPPGILARVASGIVMTAVFVAAAMFSAVFFAIFLTVGVTIGLWFWWRTRELRRAMQAELRRAENAAAPGRVGVIIEGEVVRDATQRERTGG